MSIATLFPPSPAPPALATPTLSVVRPDDADTAPVSLEALAIRAAARWVRAVRREAIAAIREPELVGLFALEVRRTERNFQAAILVVRAAGPEGSTVGVHARAHRAARRAVGR